MLSERKPSTSRRFTALAAASALVATGTLLSPTSQPDAHAADTSIRINEIVTNDPVLADAIELTNTGTQAVNVSGWIIKDGDDTRTDALPEGTLIGAGEYLVLRQDGTPGFTFGLGNGDAARLYLPDGTTLVDGHTFASHAQPSWSRCPDGTGDFLQANSVTLGGPNDCDVEQVGPHNLVLNEVDSGPLDGVEFFNTGTQPLDIGGYVLTDNAPNDATHRYAFPSGTLVPARGYLVVDGGTFTFGLGGADSVHLFAPGETAFDPASALQSFSWTAHPAIGGDEAVAGFSRCPNVTGEEWVVTYTTSGGFNDCPGGIVINEVESDGDSTDWVEVVNSSDAPIDLSGWTVMDDDPFGHAGQTAPLPSGTVLGAGEYFVFDQGTHFSFGLGANDVASVRDADGTVVAESAWAAHAAVSIGRCPGTTGPMVDQIASTKGLSNACDGVIPEDPEPETPINTITWPGSPDVTVLDTTATFLADSSGLDVEQTEDGSVLWGVDNDAGTIFKSHVAADGSFTLARGWEDGRNVRFQTDTGPEGPDAEGITVSGDGSLYVAVERDNNAKGVNLNKVLKVDPDAAGATIVASQEWDLTADLPAVSANTGLEAVEWVADADLAGVLWDDALGKPYEPADHPGHGDGLFFVALEANGHVYGYALNADGTFARVSETVPYLGGVMALDWDTDLGVLWAVCDNGCNGLATQITFNGTDAPGLVHVERPASMPNLNNEGFATATADLCTDGVRPAWWFADGEQPGALRTGTLPCADAVPPFSDVPVGTEHFDAIAWMKNAGLTTGWPDGTFRPTTAVNRDAMAAFLYRAAGSPSVAGLTEPFADVTPTTEHYAAIVWAANEGVTTGWPDGTFRPTAPIDRNAMMAFLYRYSGSPDHTPPTVSPFSDLAPTDPFYAEITWAHEHDITTGWPDGTFRPYAHTHRDAMAAFFQRFTQDNGYSHNSEANR
ncbi:lamin tail domain-containing protein [Propioniciclava soli]|uniref:Lamin tail domain-containing protein n=1 Tax=Propioniciclava soli TaxID=2775081 RepID=A0ABZ3C7B9_9ACTN